jgi:hypothetical protein
MSCNVYKYKETSRIFVVHCKKMNGANSTSMRDM